MGEQTRDSAGINKETVPVLAEGERVFWRSILSTERKRLLTPPAAHFPWRPLGLIAALTFLYFLL